MIIRYLDAWGNLCCWWRTGFRVEDLKLHPSGFGYRGSDSGTLLRCLRGTPFASVSWEHTFQKLQTVGA